MQFFGSSERSSRYFARHFALSFYCLQSPSPSDANERPFSHFCCRTFSTISDQASRALAEISRWSTRARSKIRPSNVSTSFFWPPLLVVAFRLSTNFLIIIAHRYHRHRSYRRRDGGGRRRQQAARVLSLPAIAIYIHSAASFCGLNTRARAISFRCLSNASIVFFFPNSFGHNFNIEVG